MFCDNNFLFKFASLSFHFPSSTFLRVLSNKGWIWFHTSVRLLSFTSNFRRENDFASLKKSNMKSVCLPAGDSSFRIFNPLPSVPLNYSGQNPWALYSPQMSFSPLSPSKDISFWSKLCQSNMIKFVALWLSSIALSKGKYAVNKCTVLPLLSAPFHFHCRCRLARQSCAVESRGSTQHFCRLTSCPTWAGSCHRYPCHRPSSLFLMRFQA